MYSTKAYNAYIAQLLKFERVNPLQKHLLLTFSLFTITISIQENRESPPGKQPGIG